MIPEFYFDRKSSNYKILEVDKTAVLFFLTNLI